MAATASTRKIVGITNQKIGSAHVRLGWATTVSPSKSIVPSVGSDTPAMTLKNVVLPAPFGPMRLTIDPVGMSKSTARTATRPPKRLVICLASRMSEVDAGGVEPAAARGMGVSAVIRALPSGRVPSARRPPVPRAARAAGGGWGTGPRAGTAS